MQTKSKSELVFQWLEDNRAGFAVFAVVTLTLVSLAMSAIYGWGQSDDPFIRFTIAAAYVALPMAIIAMAFMRPHLPKGALKNCAGVFLLFLILLDIFAALSFRFEAAGEQEARHNNFKIASLENSIKTSQMAVDTAKDNYRAAVDNGSIFQKSRHNQYLAAQEEHNALLREYNKQVSKHVADNQVVYVRLAELFGVDYNDIKTIVMISFTVAMVATIYMLTEIVSTLVQIHKNGAGGSTPPPRGTRTKKEQTSSDHEPVVQQSTTKPEPMSAPVVAVSAPKPVQKRTAPKRAEPLKPRVLETRPNQKFEGFCAELESNKFTDLKTRTIVSHSKFINSMDTARKYLNLALDAVPNLEAYKDEQGKVHYRYKTNARKLRAV